MPEVLRGERVVLRRARMSDLGSVHAIMSDPRVMRYWSTPPHENLHQTEEWLRAMVLADPAHSDDFILECEGEVVGKLGCWKLPEIGFHLARDRWGQGIASEALDLFLRRRRSLGEPGRLVADVDPRNLASLALLRRHGFVETGRASATWEVGGELCDSVYLALDL